MKKNNILITIASIALIFICFVPAILIFNKKQEAYDIWFVGDSLFAGSSDGKSIPSFVANETGFSVLNAGFGGLTMARAKNIDYSDVSLSYNLVDISEGIKNKDLSFAALNRFKLNQYHVDYWDKHALDLSKAAIDKCKYIFIGYGTNDSFIPNPVENEYDKYDIYTYAGALRTAIENIKKGMPNAELVLVTPPFNNIDPENKVLSAYVAKELEIADEYGLYVINNYELSGINKENYEKFLIDGVHPNEEGISILATPMVEYIKDKQD